MTNNYTKKQHLKKKANYLFVALACCLVAVVSFSQNDTWYSQRMVLDSMRFNRDSLRFNRDSVAVDALKKQVDDNQKNIVFMLNDQIGRLREVRDSLQMINSLLSLQKDNMKNLADSMAGVKAGLARIAGAMPRLESLEQQSRLQDSVSTVMLIKNYTSCLDMLANIRDSLKPLETIQRSRSFLKSYTAFANPMTYTEFNQWFGYFEAYVEKNKNDNYVTATAYNTLNIYKSKGDSALSQLFQEGFSPFMYSAFDLFIDDLRKRSDKKELSKRMMQLLEQVLRLNTSLHNASADWKKESDDLGAGSKEWLQLNKQVL